MPTTVLDWTKIIHLHSPKVSMMIAEEAGSSDSDVGWVADDDFVIIIEPDRCDWPESTSAVEEWPSIRKESSSVICTLPCSLSGEENPNTFVDLRSCGADLDRPPQNLTECETDKYDEDAEWSSFQKWESIVENLTKRRLRHRGIEEAGGHRYCLKRAPAPKASHSRKFRHQSAYATKHEEIARKAAHKRYAEEFEQTAWVDPKRLWPNPHLERETVVATCTRRGAERLRERAAVRRAGRIVARAVAREQKASRHASRQAAKAADPATKAFGSSSPLSSSHPRHSIWSTSTPAWWTNRVITVTQSIHKPNSLLGHPTRVVTLYHGTTSAAANSIIAGGFHTPKGINRDRMTGKPLLFGNAIYFALDHSKARLFGPCILRCQVKVGVSLVKTMPAPYTNKDKLHAMGCDSIHGVPGGTLNRPEYAVYDPAQVVSISRA
jgi:hypothetical protein